MLDLCLSIISLAIGIVTVRTCIRNTSDHSDYKERYKCDTTQCDSCPFPCVKHK